MIDFSDGFLSIKQVAELLGATEAHVNNLVNSNRLQGYKFGDVRCVRIRQSDLNLFIEKSKLRINTMDNMISQIIEQAQTYDGSIDALSEYLQNTTNMSKRAAESKAIELTVKVRPELLKQEQEQIEMNRLKRHGYI